MKKSIISVLLVLSITACTEITDGLRDISQGTFLNKRLGKSKQSIESNESFYDFLLDFSNGKQSNSIVSLKTTDLIHFKSLNTNTLIQTDEINYDHEFVDIFSNELKRYKINLKPSKADKQCSSPLDNKNGYLVQAYEFTVNKKKLYLIYSGVSCASCLPNPLLITKKSPCDVINNISF